MSINHKNSEPITGASISVIARNKDTNEKTVLFEGITNEQGSSDINFDIPDTFIGDYELIITSKSKHGKDQVLKSINLPGLAF